MWIEIIHSIADVTLHFLQVCLWLSYSIVFCISTRCCSPSWLMLLFLGRQSTVRLDAIKCSAFFFLFSSVGDFFYYYFPLSFSFSLFDQRNVVEIILTLFFKKITLTNVLGLWLMRVLRRLKEERLLMSVCSENHVFTDIKRKAPQKPAY